MDKSDIETRKKEIELRVMEVQKNIVEPLEAKEDFYKFCVYMDPVFFTPGKPHLKRVSELFQQMGEGKLKKIYISMPPRAGKSYVTSFFCAWMIGKNPRETIMRNSHTGSLAEDFSFFIRGLMTNEKFLKVFPDIKMHDDRQSIDKWGLKTSKTGTAYFCAGVNGNITGKGANLIAILDDPIKDIEAALSETQIESVWKWYSGVHMARMEKGCPEIHIATRWSRKDPIGRLIDPQSKEYDPEYVGIVIPALDKNGETFCEEIHTTKEYMGLKNKNDSSIWEAEFMQNPIEEKGLLFPIESLKRFSLSELKKNPDGVISACDTADEGTDYLCMPISERHGAYTYITDVLFTQDGVEITEALAAKKIIDHKVKIQVTEANSGGKSWARNVRKLVKPKWHCQFIDRDSTTNKETRILMNAGYVKEYFYFRNDYLSGSQYDTFMRWLTSYVKMGSNKHDDAPDGITLLAIYMQENFRARAKSESDLQHGGTYTYVELKMKGYKEYEIDRMAREGQIKVMGGRR
jgi:predicted phage terminase large subunit-like protein